MNNLSKNVFRLYQRAASSISVSPNLYNVCEKLLLTRYQVIKKQALYSSTVSSENNQNSIVELVSNGDKEMEHKLKVLELEVELLRQEGELVPDSHEMEPKHYIELLNLNSRSARKKYLQFIFKLCRKKENRLRKKAEKAQEIAQIREAKVDKDLPIEDFVHTYDLQHNSLFLRFRDQTINHMYNSNVIRAMQFGQKLIIDCGYDKKMTNRENLNCAKQLMLLFGENRAHVDPFDLHYCNFNRHSLLGQSLARRIATLYDPAFPLTIHQQSYNEIFPREKLVYLTPHCREEMVEYDHDAIYIVGAIVDKMNQEPLSMAKAKQENIKMCKLPLDKYLLWSGGSGKSLTLNQVVSILLDMKQTGDWKYALRHVPSRKLFRASDEIENVTKSLLKKREKWTPKALDFNQLSFNKKNKTFEDRKRKKRVFSVSSMFSK